MVWSTKHCTWRCGVQGCTPLHWAAIRDSGEACILLLQVRIWRPEIRHPAVSAEIAGSACIRVALGCLGRGAGRGGQAGADTLLLARDHTGSTPAQLAVEKGHRYLGLSLSDYRRCAAVRP